MGKSQRLYKLQILRRMGRVNINICMHKKSYQKQNFFLQNWRPGLPLKPDNLLPSSTHCVCKHGQIPTSVASSCNRVSTAESTAFSQSYDPESCKLTFEAAHI